MSYNMNCRININPLFKFDFLSIFLINLNNALISFFERTHGTFLALRGLSISEIRKFLSVIIYPIFKNNLYNYAMINYTTPNYWFQWLLNNKKFDYKS